MSISVEKFYEAVRLEGLNCGLPCTFVKFGPGEQFGKVEDFVGKVVRLARFKWVVLLGEGTTQQGMGTAVRGLWQCNLSSEFEVSGLRKDPSWLHSVNKWTVDYVEDPVFNYGSLRSGDMIRFKVSNFDDLDSLKEGMQFVSKMAAAPYVRFEPVDKLQQKEVNELTRECMSIVGNYDRARLF